MTEPFRATRSGKYTVDQMQGIQSHPENLAQPSGSQSQGPVFQAGQLPPQSYDVGQASGGAAPQFQAPQNVQNLGHVFPVQGAAFPVPPAGQIPGQLPGHGQNVGQVPVSQVPAQVRVTQTEPPFHPNMNPDPNKRIPQSSHPTYLLTASTRFLWTSSDLARFTAFITKHSLTSARGLSTPLRAELLQALDLDGLDAYTTFENKNVARDIVWPKVLAKLGAMCTDRKKGRTVLGEAVLKGEVFGVVPTPPLGSPVISQSITLGAGIADAATVGGGGVLAGLTPVQQSITGIGASGGAAVQGNLQPPPKTLPPYSPLPLAVTAENGDGNVTAAHNATQNPFHQPAAPAAATSYLSPNLPLPLPTFQNRLYTGAIANTAQGQVQQHEQAKEQAQAQIPIITTQNFDSSVGGTAFNHAPTQHSATAQDTGHSREAVQVSVSVPMSMPEEISGSMRDAKGSPVVGTGAGVGFSPRIQTRDANDNRDSRLQVEGGRFLQQQRQRQNPSQYSYQQQHPETTATTAAYPIVGQTRTQNQTQSYVHSRPQPDAQSQPQFHTRSRYVSRNDSIARPAASTVTNIASPKLQHAHSHGEAFIQTPPINPPPPLKTRLEARQQPKPQPEMQQSLSPIATARATTAALEQAVLSAQAGREAETQNQASAQLAEEGRKQEVLRAKLAALAEQRARLSSRVLSSEETSMTGDLEMEMAVPVMMGRGRGKGKVNENEKGNEAYGGEVRGMSGPYHYNVPTARAQSDSKFKSQLQGQSSRQKLYPSLISAPTSSTDQHFQTPGRAQTVLPGAFPLDTVNTAEHTNKPTNTALTSDLVDLMSIFDAGYPHHTDQQAQVPNQPYETAHHGGTTKFIQTKARNQQRHSSYQPPRCQTEYSMSPPQPRTPRRGHGPVNPTSKTQAYPATFSHGIPSPSTPGLVFSTTGTSGEDTQAELHDPSGRPLRRARNDKRKNGKATRFYRLARRLYEAEMAARAALDVYLQRDEERKELIAKMEQRVGKMGRGWSEV